jgi:uncharacterized protein (DUF58 family)
MLLRQQDSVGCLTFDEHIRAVVPQRTKRSHLNSIIASLSTNAPRDKTDLYSIFRQVAETYPRRGMMILVSDLLADRAGLVRGLKLLRQRGHDVMVFHVMDDDELDFPFNGPMRFEGLESADHLTCNPRALRVGYLEALQAYLDDVRRQCVSHTCDYSLIRTSAPMDAALATYLSNRLGMHHHV